MIRMHVGELMAGGRCCARADNDATVKTVKRYRMSFIVG
jgi:hypothetical protein